MPFEFVCPHCGHGSYVDDHLRGQTGPCAACGKPVTLPLETATAVTGARLGSPVTTRNWPWWGAAWGALTVVGVSLGLLVLWLVPAVQFTGRRLPRIECASRMQRIVGALRVYHREFGSFPLPGGAAGSRPPVSWRVLLLKQLGQQGLLNQYDRGQAWDSPDNIALVSRCPPVYQCPADVEGRIGGFTSYLMLTGPDTVVDYSKVDSLAELTDRAGNRILIVERSASEVVWLEPKDVDWRQVILEVGEDGLLRSGHDGGAHAGVLSGEVAFFPAETTADELLQRIQVGK